MSSGGAGSGSPLGRKCPECGAVLTRTRTPLRLLRSVVGTKAAEKPGRVTTGPTDPSAELQARLALARAQTASDRDQTASDRDQTASDRDQTASDRDGDIAADDQALSDRELAAGGDPVAHHRNKLARSRSSAERLITAQSRDNTAVDRWQIARERDQAAAERDSLSAVHDAAETPRPRGLFLLNALGRIHGQSREEADRARAANDRATAARDRQRAAEDRENAAALRAEAARDRAEAVRERTLAGVDQLTGVSLRSAGLGEIEREIERARRTRSPLVLAFVDVNNLKAVNDTDGHIAGDALLRRVADALRLKLRPYDVIVRFGGDEFICSLSDVGVRAVQRRFDDILAALRAHGPAQPISFGLAELEESDDLEQLIKRADEALIDTRRSGLGRI
jgi:diguanylate cyclase (GGDEF)-like protein